MLLYTTNFGVDNNKLLQGQQYNLKALTNVLDKLLYERLWLYTVSYTRICIIHVGLTILTPVTILLT